MKQVVLSLFLAFYFTFSGAISINDQEEPENFPFIFELKDEFCYREFDGPHLALEVATTNLYPCGYEFFHNITYGSQNTIDVYLGKITPGELYNQSLYCQQEIAKVPAHFKEYIDISLGAYTLNFHCCDEVDSYTLLSGFDTVKWKENKKPKNTKAAKFGFNRIPKGLMWAECYYNSDWKKNPYDNTCMNFFGELSRIATPYKVHGDSGPVYQHGLARDVPKIQYYLYMGDSEALIALSRKYGPDYPFYSIYIATWEGKMFRCAEHSWKFNDTICREPITAVLPSMKVDYTYSKPITNVTHCIPPHFFTVSNFATDEILMCIVEVAYNTNNASICDRLPLLNQEQCQWAVRIAMKQPIAMNSRAFEMEEKLKEIEKEELEEKKRREESLLAFLQ